MSERCETCACELTDFGYGVGWRCQLCHARDMLKEARADLAAMTAERDVAKSELDRQLEANDFLCGEVNERAAERDAALQRAKEAEEATKACLELNDVLNRSNDIVNTVAAHFRSEAARLAAEAEAVAYREALVECSERLHAYSDQEYGSATDAGLYETARIVLRKDAGRPLADFLARLRAAPCLSPDNCGIGTTWKCLTCQARSPNYGGT